MSHIRIGVVSDTHGLMRPEALALLAGCERIIHAGDIGGPGVLEALERVAPVVAVRGNNDHGAWAESLPEWEVVEAGGTSIYVLHDVDDLGIDPRSAGIGVVICGHSHRPHLDQRDGVLHLNPGSAGPRRFRLPVALAFLDIAHGRAAARLHLIEP